MSTKLSYYFTFQHSSFKTIWIKGGHMYFTVCATSDHKCLMNFKHIFSRKKKHMPTAVRANTLCRHSIAKCEAFHCNDRLQVAARRVPHNVNCCIVLLSLHQSQPYTTDMRLCGAHSHSWQCSKVGWERGRGLLSLQGIKFWMLRPATCPSTNCGNIIKPTISSHFQVN